MGKFAIKVSFMNVTDYESFERDFELAVVESISETIMNHSDAYFKLDVDVYWQNLDNHDSLVYQFNKLDDRDIEEKAIQNLVEVIDESLFGNVEFIDLDYSIEVES